MLTFSGSSRPQDGKPPGLEEPRQKSSKEDALPDDASSAAGYNNADYSATNYVAQTVQKRLDTEDVIDPLEGMPASDKWGLKGLTTLMNNYPDYHAMVVGMDPNSLGLDINSQEFVFSRLATGGLLTCFSGCFRLRSTRCLMTHLLGQSFPMEDFDCRIVIT